MGTTLEFHDSEVRAVEADGHQLRVEFSAAHLRGYVRHTGAPAVSGYARAVELRFSAASWSGPLAECVGRLAGGRVVVNGAARSSIVLPHASQGPVRAELQFSGGALLTITAGAMSCRLPADPQFSESFAC